MPTHIFAQKSGVFLDIPVAGAYNSTTDFLEDIIMFDVDRYISDLLLRLKDQYSERLLYVGLQGSYLRGEAKESSDIDIMVVVESLSVADLDAYRSVIGQLPNSDKSCGFICGSDDLLAWNPLEICHLLHSTRDYYGVLSEIVPQYGRSDVINFVRLSINNLYHEICHRYIHGSRNKNVDRLPSTYRNVFFILQNLHYLRTGVFVPTKAQLLEALTGNDRDILSAALHLENATDYDFDIFFELLFLWCRDTLRRTHFL